MNDVIRNSDQQPSGFQFPLPRSVAVASLACLLSLMVVYWIAKPVVAQLEVWWMELLVYSVVPVSLTFVILYYSNWHQEQTGAVRTCSVLALSCLILGVLLLTIGISFAALWLYAASIPKGAGR